MMSCMTDASPQFLKKAFQCPHCREVEVQEWSNESGILDQYFHAQEKFSFDYSKKEGFDVQFTIKEFVNYLLTRRDIFNPNDSYHRAECAGCKQISIWVNKKMVYPLTPSAPAPMDDMPPSVKKVYEEARLVEAHSKRAAMVLLRVCLEKLMAHLQMKGKTLHEKIKNLAKKGVTEEAIRWLLAVKVMGNEAAHIANIDPNDKEIVENLNKVFTTINLIVTVTITLKNIADDLTKKPPKNGNQTNKNP